MISKSGFEFLASCVKRTLEDAPQCFDRKTVAYMAGRLARDLHANNPKFYVYKFRVACAVRDDEPQMTRMFEAGYTGV